MIRKWSEVLRRRMMWRGCIDEEMHWWCVRSWDEIRMVHRSMRNGSRVADGLYIKRVLLALEDFLFFSLYSFSCIANNSTTLKTFSTLVFVLVRRYALRVQSCNIHFTCARPNSRVGSTRAWLTAANCPLDLGDRRTSPAPPRRCVRRSAACRTRSLAVRS